VPLLVIDTLVAGPMIRLLAPRKTSEEISADELSAVLEISARRGVIDRDAGGLLQEIVELADIRAADVMVPRVDLVTFDINLPRARLEDLFRDSRLRRIPVHDGQVDNILGVIHSRDLLRRKNTPLADLVVKLPFLPEAANLERVLLQLRVLRQQAAIVVDEFGGVAGIVTLRDVLEEIVGDLPADADQPAETVQQVSDNRFIIDGDLPIHEWVEAFGIDIDRRRISTVGGFVSQILGRIPKVNDIAEYRNLRFTVQSIRRRRVGKLAVELKGRTP
jgi:putative hemolysin